MTWPGSNSETLPPAQPAIWIVEDEPAAAQVAVDLVELAGAPARVFRDQEAYLDALRADPPPQVVVLDWRLERELAAALFLATRHRHPRLPVVFWTASREEALPAVLRGDPNTRIVPKVSGLEVLEAALRWGMEQAEAAGDGVPSETAAAG